MSANTPAATVSASVQPWEYDAWARAIVDLDRRHKRRRDPIAEVAEALAADVAKALRSGARDASLVVLWDRDKAQLERASPRVAAIIGAAMQIIADGIHAPAPGQFIAFQPANWN